MALSSKDIPRPVRRKSVIEIEGVGEFIVQSLDLVDRINFQRQLHKDESLEETDLIPWVLHRSIVNPDGTKFWTEAEWRDFGSSLEGVGACAKLYGEVQRLFLNVEKKDEKSAESTDSPSDSASPSA